MRTYLQIDLGKQNVNKETVSGEDLAKAGRYHIVKTLLARGTANVDPLSPENPLIFSAGPFAGTNALRPDVCVCCHETPPWH